VPLAVAIAAVGAIPAAAGAIPAATAVPAADAARAAELMPLAVAKATAGEAPDKKLPITVPKAAKAIAAPTAAALPDTVDTATKAAIAAG